MSKRTRSSGSTRAQPKKVVMEAPKTPVRDTEIKIEQSPLLFTASSPQACSTPKAETLEPHSSQHLTPKVARVDEELCSQDDAVADETLCGVGWGTDRPIITRRRLPRNELFQKITRTPSTPKRSLDSPGNADAVMQGIARFERELLEAGLNSSPRPAANAAAVNMETDACTPTRPLRTVDDLATTPTRRSMDSFRRHKSSHEIGLENRSDLFDSDDDSLLEICSQAVEQKLKSGAAPAPNQRIVIELPAVQPQPPKAAPPSEMFDSMDEMVLLQVPLDDIVSQHMERQSSSKCGGNGFVRHSSMPASTAAGPRYYEPTKKVFTKQMSMPAQTTQESVKARGSSVQLTSSSSSSDGGKGSQVKCTKEEIEKKRLAALERLKARKTMKK